MAGFILLLALVTPYFHDKIKGIDDYAFFVAKPAIKYEFINDADDENDSITAFTYSPVVSSFTGLSIGAKYAQITIVFQNDDDHKIKESSLLDLQLRGVYQKFLWDLYYQNYQGLYLSDDNDNVDDSLLQANANSWGMGFKYFLDKDYGPRKSLGHYKRYKNKVSDSSWLWGMFYNQANLISTSDNLIPSEQAQSFSQVDGINEFSTQNYGIEFGWTGLYLYKNFHASGLFSFSYSYQEQELNGLNITDRKTNASGGYILLDGGHNWSSSTLGLNISTQSIKSTVQNVDLNQSRSVFKIYYKYFF